MQPSGVQCASQHMCLQCGPRQQKSVAARSAAAKAHQEARTEQRRAQERESAAARRQHKAALRAAKSKLQREDLQQVGAAFAAQTERMLAQKSAGQQAQAPTFIVNAELRSCRSSTSAQTEGRQTWTPEVTHSRAVAPATASAAPTEAHARPWRRHSRQRSEREPSIEIYVSRGASQTVQQHEARQSVSTADGDAAAVRAHCSNGAAHRQSGLQPHHPSAMQAAHGTARHRSTDHSPAAKSCNVLADMDDLLSSEGTCSHPDSPSGHRHSTPERAGSLNHVGALLNSFQQASAGDFSAAGLQPEIEQAELTDGQAARCAAPPAEGRCADQAANTVEQLEMVRLQLEADLGADLLLEACTCLQQGVMHSSAGLAFTDSAIEHLRQLLKGRGSYAAQVQKLVVLEDALFCAQPGPCCQ